MTLISRLFGRGPKRDQWVPISTNIATGLDEVRKLFWDGCVDLLDQVSKDSKTRIQMPTKSPVRRQPSREAEIIMKAFQLWYISGFLLPSYKYIPKSDGKEFSDLLWAQVGGTDVHEVFAYARRYEDARENLGTLVFRFSIDISRHLTEDDAPVAEAMCVSRLIDYLMSTTTIVVANAFGDQGTVEKLKTQTQE